MHRGVHGIEVEASGIEESAIPLPHCQVLRMHRVDSLQEVAVARWPAHIFRRTGVGSGYAKRASVLRAGLQGALDMDPVAPFVVKSRR
jgi:hypothetical protein